METKTNKKAVADLDETLLLNSIAEPGIVKEAPKPAPEPAKTEKEVETAEQPSEKSKEEHRTKRDRQQEYESRFIRESDLPPARFGKSVYIRKAYHDRISQIISVIGANEVSLFGYIDNVLTHHFESFGDDITQSFKKNIIFK